MIQIPEEAYVAAETAGRLHGSIRSGVEAAAPLIVAANCPSSSERIATVIVGALAAMVLFMLGLGVLAFARWVL